MVTVDTALGNAKTIPGSSVTVPWTLIPPFPSKTACWVLKEADFRCGNPVVDFLAVVVVTEELMAAVLLTGTSAGTIQEHFQIVSHRCNGERSSCDEDVDLLLPPFLGVEYGLEPFDKVPAANVTDRTDSKESSSCTAALPRMGRTDGLVRIELLLLLSLLLRLAEWGDVNRGDRRGDDLTGLDVGFFLRNEKTFSSSRGMASLVVMLGGWCAPLTKLVSLLGLVM